MYHPAICIRACNGITPTCMGKRPARHMYSILLDHILPTIFYSRESITAETLSVHASGSRNHRYQAIEIALSLSCPEGGRVDHILKELAK